MSRLVGALTASTVTYIPPVVAVIIGATFLREPVLPTTILAIVLILAAAGVIQMPFSGGRLRPGGYVRKREPRTCGTNTEP